MKNYLKLATMAAMLSAGVMAQPSPLSVRVKDLGGSAAPTGACESGARYTQTGAVPVDWRCGSGLTWLRATGDVRGSTGSASVSQTLTRFYAGGLTGKKVVYFGNSTVWNAVNYFTRVYGEMATGHALEGMSARSDVTNLVSDSSSNVTVTLSAAVGTDAIVGQWVSLNTISGAGANGCLGSGIVSALGANTITFQMVNGSCASIASTAATGWISKSFLNFGNNGASLSYMLGLSSSTATGIGGVCAVAPDLLIVRGPIINDVRLGATTLGQATARITSLIDAVRACSPNTDIVLKSENSMLTTDVGSAGYVSPNASAQAYSTILQQAVLAQIGLYPNVVVYDTQALLYGVTSPATSPHMVDQLHPGPGGALAEAEIDIQILGQLRPAAFQRKSMVMPSATDAVAFSPYLAELARAASFASPWTFYPHACADPDYYDLVAYGKATNTSSAGQTYFDFSWPGGAGTVISPFDVVHQESSGCWRLSTCAGGGASGANARVNLQQGCAGATTPYPTRTNEQINIWRPKFSTAAAEAVIRNTQASRYVRRIYVQGAGNGYFDFSFWGQDRFLVTGTSAISSADTLYLATNGTVSLSACNLSNSGYMRCLKSGDQSALNGDWGFVVGTHPMEESTDTAGLSFLSIGSTIASAATIAPTNAVTHISGTTTINTITVPYTGFKGCLRLIPDGLWSTGTSVNIQIATTAVVSKMLEICYDGSKWYPSY